MLKDSQRIISTKASILLVTFFLLYQSVKADPNLDIFDMALIFSPYIIGGLGILMNLIYYFNSSAISRFLSYSFTVLNVLLFIFLVVKIQGEETVVLSIATEHHMLFNLSLIPFLLKHLRSLKPLSRWWIYAFLLYIIPQFLGGLIFNLLDTEIFKLLTIAGIFPSYYIVAIVLLFSFSTSYFKSADGNHSLKSFVFKGTLISSTSYLFGMLFYNLFNDFPFLEASLPGHFLLSFLTTTGIGLLLSIICFFSFKAFYLKKNIKS